MYCGSVDLTKLESREILNLLLSDSSDDFLLKFLFQVKRKIIFNIMYVRNIPYRFN